MILTKNVKVFFLSCNYKCVVISKGSDRMAFTVSGRLHFSEIVVVPVTSTLAGLPMRNSFLMGVVSKIRCKMVHCVTGRTY